MATLADQATRREFRDAVKDIALSQKGEHESPSGSNITVYGHWYGLDGMAWCGQFVSWVYWKAAREVGCENPLAHTQGPKGFAHCTSFFSLVSSMGIVVGTNEEKFVGDIVVWDHDQHIGGPGHTGIIVGIDGSGALATTVEGNTDTRFRNTGGNVMSHRHDLGDGKHGRLLGLVRPTRRFPH